MALIKNAGLINPVINVAQKWIKHSLIGDSGVFLADLLWTEANVDDVREAFVDHPDEGTDDFLTKLKRQMKPASPSGQHLMAEMLWALLLFPSNINPSTKRELINQVWSLSGDALPQDLPHLKDSTLSGVGGAGVGFNTHRWRELVFLIELVGDLKRRSPAERQNLFDEYETFVAWISSLPQGTGRQFKHMLRYFAFPERVEPISSNQDRQSILQAFEVGSKKETRKWNDDQLDAALLVLREQLEDESPDLSLNFYEEPFLSRWRTKTEKMKTSEAQDISFTVEDCGIFSKYPSGSKWTDVSSPDQQLFRSVRDRLKRFAKTVSGNAAKSVVLQDAVSSLNPNTLAPKDMWSCVYPKLVGNKSFGWQVAIIISPRGAEICFCRGAGKSQVNDLEKKVESEAALTKMLERLKGTPSQMISSIEKTLERKWFYRRSWRDEPNVDDFPSFEEWFEFASSATGNGASISIYLEPIELEQTGTSIAKIFEEALESFWPIIEYAYGPLTNGDLVEIKTEIPSISFDGEVLSVGLSAIQATHFNVEEKFFFRFVSALLTKPFLILTGNSGTGKTKLAELFVRWLSRNVPARFSLVAVGADWTDNRNIVGFVNHLRSTNLRDDGADYQLPIYQSTKVLDLLLMASRPENSATPYFLILDEMNLSHVERYFADFLSAIELQNGELTLHREGRRLPRTSGGLYDVPETLLLPDNLFVIGTVNVDETTYMFSPKVLDRANVIEFRVSANAAKEFLNNDHRIVPVEPAPLGYAEGFLELAFRARGLGSNPLSFASNDLSPADQEGLQGCRTTIDDLFSIMEKRRQEFAFRTMTEIVRYLTVSYELTRETEEWAWRDALDAQILQKVLPKLHGSKRKIGSLLAALAKYCEQGNRSDAEAYLNDETKAESYLATDKRENSPRYETSYRKLCEMMEAVRRDQFVSFIQ